MFLRVLCLPLIWVAVLPVAHGATLSLSEALARARGSDPVYLMALANVEVARERSNQAAAMLRPQLSATVTTNGNRRDYTVRDTPFPPTADDYNSNSAQLTLNQPLWRHASTIALTQADAVVDQVEFQRAAAEQDLLVRLAQSWFDLMLARDAALAARVQLAAAQFQWQQYRHAFKVGLAAAPTLEDARAKFDQAQAELASTQAEQDAKLAALEQIVGTLPAVELPALAAGYVALDVRGQSVDQWLSEADRNSPAVWSAQYALVAAQEEIRKQRAGHEPTLDLVATYGRNGQAAGGFPGQNGYRIKQGVVGVQFNMPLFAGGGQKAKVGEALAMRDKAGHELEAARRQVRLSVKQAWLYWHAGAARHLAGLQGVKAATMGAGAAVSGQGHGLKSAFDVIQSEYQRYAAWRDLQKSRYDMITSHLKLVAAVGRLGDDDLLALDRWFEPDAAKAVDLFLGRYPDLIAQGTP